MKTCVETFGKKITIQYKKIAQNKTKMLSLSRNSKCTQFEILYALMSKYLFTGYKTK